jgi:hypothetical protein
LALRLYVALLSRLWLLNAIFRSSLVSLAYASGLLGSTNDVISNARKVLNSTTSDKNNGVLLQVVAFARNVGGDFDTVGQSNTSSLSKS